MSYPRISVIIPAYNAEAFLRATIESVLSQTSPAHEIIVVDDGSTDATTAVALSFQGRVTLVCQQNQGPSAARNAGIRVATGDWIAFLDADDIMLPNKLSLQSAAIQANPTLAVVYSTFAYLHADGTTTPMAPFQHVDLWPALRYRQPILPSTALVRADALREIGGFTLHPDRYFPEDWDLWFRLMQRYGVCSFYGVPASLTLYRQSAAQISTHFLQVNGAALGMLDDLLLSGLGGLSKSLWRRRIEARLFYRTALSLREQGDPRYWSFAVASFLLWPFSGAIVPRDRYKVLAHMAYTRLRTPQPRLRYWWPERDCKEHLRRERVLR